YIDDTRFIRQAALEAFAEQLVYGDQECGEGLPRSGRRRNQRVPAVADRMPAHRLRGSGITKARREPLGDDGMKILQRRPQSACLIVPGHCLGMSPPNRATTNPIVPMLCFRPPTLRTLSYTAEP